MTATTYEVLRRARAEEAIKALSPAARARYTVRWFLTGQRPVLVA